MTAYNARYNASEEWTGMNHRGFDNDRNLAICQRIQDIQDNVDGLHNRAPTIAVDFHSVQEAVEYDPNTDLRHDSLIQEAFEEQRMAHRVGSVDDVNGKDMDTKALLMKYNETLAAICNLRISYYNEDFKNREMAKKSNRLYGRA